MRLLAAAAAVPVVGHPQTNRIAIANGKAQEKHLPDSLARRTIMPWIEANGASLRYELSGSGAETLVLMHEAGGCLES